MRRWRISGVRESSDGCWLVDYEGVDGDADSFTSSVPKGALEMRCAEFGLDTISEALEVIVYSPILRRMDGGAAGGPTSHAASAQPVNPLLAGTSEHRRRAVRERIEACRQTFGTVDSSPTTDSNAATAGTDPLQVITDNTRIDPVRLAALRLQIDRELAVER